MQIYSKENIKISGIKLIVILSVGLFFIYSFWLTKMPSPYFTDEVGYWGCAAHFAGIDWTSVTSKMAYFGYGYGFFLFPLFLLGDSRLIYEGALILNIIFIECVFWMLIQVLNKMFSKESEMENIFCAFVGCLYSAFIIYSHTTMSETCILFFLVLLVLLIQKYCEKPKIIYGGFIALILFELLAIHLRNLIFLAITFLFLFFLVIAKKKNIRNIFITVFFIGVAVVLALILKEYITENVFTDVVTNTHIDSNDNISQRLWFVSQLLNIEWWKNYLINVLCKSFYLVLSSLFVIVFAAIGLFKEFKNFGDLIEKPFNIFLLMLLICSILYESLIMFAGGSSFRIDILFYGRYIECIMPIFCAIGLTFFLRKKKSYKDFKIYFIVFVVILIISQIAFSYYNNHDISLDYANILPLQITGFSWLISDKPASITQMLTMFAVIAYLFLGIIIYFIIKNKWISIVAIAVCWVTFAYMGWNAFGLNLNETTDISAMSRVQRMEKINEVADYLNEIDCEEVYYIFNPESVKPDFFDMFTLQFDVVKVKLITIAGEAIADVPEDSLIVVNYCSDYYGEVINNYEIKFQNDFFIVAQRHK